MFLIISFIKGITFSFQSLADEKDIRLEIHSDIDSRLMDFDRDKLEKIMYNLLSNAIKYRSDERPLKVKISTKKSDKHIILSVEDNGLGMSKYHQKKLFSMFKRFHTHVDGTGIGLYIVKRIIENKKGKIEVESEEGKGTTFRIYFDTSRSLK